MIRYHPQQGTIVICDFKGLSEPEMTKRRPAILLTPPMKGRHDLCAVVPLSGTAPNRVKPYHFKIHTNPPLPEPYTNTTHWVKGDMVYTMGLNRMFLPLLEKEGDGTRKYDIRVIDEDDLIKIKACVLHGLGMGELTGYL